MKSPTLTLRRSSKLGAVRKMLGRQYPQTKKASSYADFLNNWSERQDSNLRPSGPKPDALPNCATLRRTELSSIDIRIDRQVK